MTLPDGYSAADGEAHVLTMVHNPERNRYELHDNDRVVGSSIYGRRPSHQVVFTHTEVDAAYAGRGLAARLTRFALDDVRANGGRIIPVCPYVTGYLRKHHEYDDIVDLPQFRMPNERRGATS
ncbi:MAG TPA: GNAT family N-acetyltransferase [Glaciibacter sp.]|nr:GNAT family N-acetyltransferase [Glaciibacter sp.]